MIAAKRHNLRSPSKMGSCTAADKSSQEAKSTTTLRGQQQRALDSDIDRTSRELSARQPPTPAPAAPTDAANPAADAAAQRKAARVEARKAAQKAKEVEKQVTTSS